MALRMRLLERQAINGLLDWGVRESDMLALDVAHCASALTSPIEDPGLFSPASHPGSQTATPSGEVRMGMRRGLVGKLTMEAGCR